MWVFWLLSLLPICICGALVLLDREISVWEWLVSTAVSIIMTIIFQYASISGMMADVETWSGYATSAKHFAAWHEYYEYAVYRTEQSCSTDSKGEEHCTSYQVFDHWEPDQRWHPDYWKVYTTIGDWDIDQSKFEYICRKFNSYYAVAGVRTTSEHASRMIGGDPNDYETVNKTGWIEPVTDTRKFKNKVKAAPSLFSYSPVPTNIIVYPWPQSDDLFVSRRVMGYARSSISTLKWDQMNAVIGGSKKVNVIIVGFGNQGMGISEYQEAAWIGGKKNDLVICYGGEKDEPATWVRVFGWTEKNIVKKNLESLLLTEPVDNDIIPKIQSEVIANYVIKDWKKFDYIRVEPPTWTYFLYFGVMIVVQGGLFFYFQNNDINRDNDGTDGFWQWLNRLRY
jgi:hypothetical protein